MTTTTYHGVMDCHGVESFREYESEFGRNCLTIRANSNPQRHAIYFQAEIPKPEFLAINKMLEGSNWKDACRYIKTLDGVRFFGPGKINKIPDSSIDPYHPDYDEEEADN